MANIEQQLEQARQLREEGRLAEAARLFKHILVEEPENAAASFEWGCIAFERGNFANAERLFKSTLAINPANFEAYTKLGVIYFNKEWLGWARQCFELAIEKNEDYLPAYNNLAIIYLKLGDPWKAEKICREALVKDKNYGPVYTVLGNALHQQERAGEAIDVFATALEMKEDGPQNLYNLGVIYIDMADHKKAESCFEKALKIAPDYAQAHYSLAGVHKYKKEDSHIAAMQALLEKKPRVSADASYLHFGLGKAYHDIGEYDAAFTHYAQGNYVVRSRFQYSTKITEEDFTRLKKIFGQGFEAEALKPRQKDFTPIFIVGMPRSGTTLMEQILFAHPDVAAGGERAYIDQLQEKYGFSATGQDGEDITKYPRKKLLGMRDDYLEMLERHAPGAIYITDKMPVNFRYIGLIRLLFPQAKVIHCRREPMDCCFSIFRHLFIGHFPFAYDLKELGQYYKYYEDMMAFWHHRLPGFIHDVQYEKLIADQEGESRKLLAFCELEWEPSCLSFHKQERIVMTASALQVKKPLYKNAIGSWKKYEKHLRLLENELT